MTVELRRDVDPDFGLVANLQLETYSGFGEEEGTTNPNGTANGKVWVECPQTPSWYRWRSAFRLVRSNDFEIVTP